MEYLYSMINSPLLVSSFRHDLRSLFNHENSFGGNRFVDWIILSGIHEYRVFTEDLLLKSWLSENDSSYGVDLTRLQLFVYHLRKDLVGVFELPKDRDGFVDWFYTNAIDELRIVGLLDETQLLMYRLANLNRQPDQIVPYFEMKNEVSLSRACSDRLGLNLVGHFGGGFGVSEDVRMLYQALVQNGIPVSTIDVTSLREFNLGSGETVEEISNDFSYRVNLFCMTAIEFGQYVAIHGESVLEGFYNIGFWPWELSKWPSELRYILQLIDEVWVHSAHSASSLFGLFGGILKSMPVASDIGVCRKFPNRNIARKHYDLPMNAYVFCSAFDMNSYFSRKNPLDLIQAFKQAFPSEVFGVQEVHLVIRVLNCLSSESDYQKLIDAAAGDLRIRFVIEELKRSEILGLFDASDCFVSLHRAEGFGRCILESLQLGLKVIATGYSGNLEFCNENNSSLVDFSIIDVEENAYLFSSGQVWAQPDVSHACRLMIQAREEHFREKTPALISEFSPQAVGQIYSDRIKQVFDLFN